MRDPVKRKLVMQRSMRLGHCICDPKKPCPCDTLREKDVCPCAGERLPSPAGPLRLTELVDSAGCASKIDQATLTRLLFGLPNLSDPRVLLGLPAGDDAGVYQLDEETALVQTVDVFTPSVDDPYVFGQIAAANSLSDIYAMGGRPITALSIIGFPARVLPDEVMRQILLGGLDKMAEAKVPVIGGHSINDPQVKAGFAVTGLIHPKRIASNAGARPGDSLVLTKPLGTGILCFARQIGRAPPEGLDAAERSMVTLNKQAAELMLEFDVHALTDVTGFGLMGHLMTMASASKVDVEIVFDDVPVFPGVLQCASDGIMPGAVERNKESCGHALGECTGVSSEALDILFDPQTSGGLLIAIPESSEASLLARFRECGLSDARTIGRVMSPGRGKINIKGQGRRRLPVASGSPGRNPTMEAKMDCCSGAQEAATESEPGEEGAKDTKDRYLEFLESAHKPGALDARTKRAIDIALSVFTRCEQCVKIHIRKAREMGFSQQEIDEAAWMAVAFGGSPTMMFYNELKKD